MKTRVWRYEVPFDVRAEFEREYGPDGAWATLFAESAGFVDTRLYAEVAVPGSYLTVDRFADERAWEEFQRDHGRAYAELGRRLAHLTRAQEELA